MDAFKPLYNAIGQALLEDIKFWVPVRTGALKASYDVQMDETGEGVEIRLVTDKSYSVNHYPFTDRVRPDAANRPRLFSNRDFAPDAEAVLAQRFQVTLKRLGSQDV